MLSSLLLSLQRAFPQQSLRYSAYIEMPRAYVSGLLVLRCESATVKGSLFNEFGITALHFTYDRGKDKVRLQEVMPLMNRWYIRRVLRRDLREVVKLLEKGDTLYEDSRYKIKYKFSPLVE